MQVKVIEQFYFECPLVPTGICKWVWARTTSLIAIVVAVRVLLIYFKSTILKIFSSSRCWAGNIFASFAKAHDWNENTPRIQPPINVGFRWMKIESQNLQQLNKNDELKFCVFFPQENNSDIRDFNTGIQNKMHSIFSLPCLNDVAVAVPFPILSILPSLLCVSSHQRPSAISDWNVARISTRDFWLDQNWIC